MTFLIQDIKKKVYLTYRDEDKKNLVLEKIKNTDLTTTDNILKIKTWRTLKQILKKMTTYKLSKKLQTIQLKVIFIL